MDNFLTDSVEMLPRTICSLVAVNVSVKLALRVCVVDCSAQAQRTSDVRDVPVSRQEP
jgi:hypothetical protein